MSSSIDQYNAAADRPGKPRLKGRARFEAFAKFCGSTADIEEAAHLSDGHTDLPERGTDEYWDRLTGLTARAQDEHDAAVSA
jgi:acyl-CoA-binding protein